MLNGVKLINCKFPDRWLRKEVIYDIYGIPQSRSWKECKCNLPFLTCTLTWAVVYISALCLKEGSAHCYSLRPWFIWCQVWGFPPPPMGERMVRLKCFSCSPTELVVLIHGTSSLYSSLLTSGWGSTLCFLRNLILKSSYFVLVLTCRECSCSQRVGLAVSHWPSNDISDGISDLTLFFLWSNHGISRCLRISTEPANL